MTTLAVPGIVSSAKRLVILVPAIAGLIIELARRRRTCPKGPKLGFLPSHWLLGMVPEIIKILRAAQKNQLFELVHRQHKTYGQTFAVKAPMKGWAIRTTCPKNVEHILKTNFDNYPKGREFQSICRDLLGVGIFNIDGTNWHTQRKVSSHMFTANLFREHIWVVVRRNARKLRGLLESSAPDQVVDVFNLINRFTLDTIGEIGFGKCIGSLEDPSSPFLESFDKAQHITFWRLRNPIWKVARFFGLGTESEACEHFGRLDAYSRSIVRELCSVMGRGGSKTTDVGWADLDVSKSFVGLFLEDARKRGESLSEDFLRDLVLNFLIAGRDTTAQALSWTVYCLSQHPEVEIAARREIIEVCGVRGPSYEDLQHLPYLGAVINEALRLYPSVPMDGKVSLHSDTLPDGTFVPAGCYVVYDILCMGRDTSIWGEDAETFRPERWLDMTHPGNYAYPVFNAGPRECLGKRLAMVEMKTCLATLLPNLSFQLAVPSDQITPAAQLTIGMAQGLPCFVKATVGKEKNAGSSNVPTTDRSDCDTTLSEAIGESSEIEQTVAEESDVESDACSVCSQGPSRQRTKKRA